VEKHLINTSRKTLSDLVEEFLINFGNQNDLFLNEAENTETEINLEMKRLAEENGEKLQIGKNGNYSKYMREAQKNISRRKKQKLKKVDYY
jgi:excinuclease UvrABC nuclease subunit